MLCPEVKLRGEIVSSKLLILELPVPTPVRASFEAVNIRFLEAALDSDARSSDLEKLANDRRYIIHM
jgi:hypothetical protein